MFVMTSLIYMYLQRRLALFEGMVWPSAPVKRVARAAKLVAAAQWIPLAPIHAPTARLID